MKIGFFTDGYLPQPNGVATAVDSTAKALERRGHEVFIVAPKQPGYKDRENVFRLTSMKIYGKGDYRLALNLPEKPLRDALKIDFDIIHGHAGGPITFLGWQVARLKNIPYVGTYHTLWNRYTHYILKGTIVRPKVAEVATRIFGNLTDYLVAPTPRVKQELLSYGVKKPITIISSGLDLRRFRGSEKGYLRKKLGIKKGKILLYVGRLGPEKSVDFLVKMFREVYKKHPDSHLVFVGDGPDRERLKLMARKAKVHKSVHFTGYIDQKEIQKVYPDADIFVFASDTETQGLVIIEAFASGLPVVVVEDKAYEGVVLDGKNGYLAPKRLQAFAQKVINLLESEEKRKEFAEGAKKTAKNYSVDVTAEKLEKLYKRVISKYKKKKRLVQRIKDIRDFISLTNRVNKLKNIFGYP